MFAESTIRRALHWKLQLSIMIRFDSVSPEVMEAMCTPLHRILAPQGNGRGSLYLGSLSAVMDKTLLREHHISHVIQIIDASWIKLSDKDGFNSYHIEILDHAAADLKPHLEGACNFIDRALKRGQNVLVHCHQGVSRSPSIIIAYLIRNYGMTFDNALALVKHQRACVKPNSGFITTLREWEDYCRRPSATRYTTT